MFDNIKNKVHEYSERHKQLKQIEKVSYAKEQAKVKHTQTVEQNKQAWEHGQAKAHRGENFKKALIGGIKGVGRGIGAGMNYIGPTIRKSVKPRKEPRQSSQGSFGFGNDNPMFGGQNRKQKQFSANDLFGSGGSVRVRKTKQRDIAGDLLR